MTKFSAGESFRSDHAAERDFGDLLPELYSMAGYFGPISVCLFAEHEPVVGPGYWKAEKHQDFTGDLTVP